MVVSDATTLIILFDLDKKEYLYNLFEKVYPTNANYFLIKLKNIKAFEFQEKLKPYKIMIRNCSTFDFLDEQDIRIAVKDIKSIEVLQTALKEITNE